MIALIVILAAISITCLSYEMCLGSLSRTRKPRTPTAKITPTDPLHNAHPLEPLPPA
ncbi:hypothetical protein Misp01_24590 [Microtetraspora sp. NBRC 13810]|uniref:hypothetical protein n=1 Tax=Microtetraspora sp. NBRC 13810 TaxID=3030990 RepID=UPI0024A1A220|nr:hypothetical protein [Microtetraspora sp. NBRC 13810]GLW07329.1 hypothetical protein Misp01_24590 [Microtetraspora sp. NBRC 13810]